MRTFLWPLLPLAFQVLIQVPFTLIPRVLSKSWLEFEHYAGRTKRTEGGIHVPIYRREKKSFQRRDGGRAAIGLGDFVDVTYNVLLRIGNTETPVVLGSSDLWVVSDACTGNCSFDFPLYPQSSFQSAGLDAQLLYGDSMTGTHAFGPIGKDTVGFTGLTLKDQYFAAINDTNTTVLQTGSAGIFGLGFPINSAIWTKVFAKHQTMSSSISNRDQVVIPPRTNLATRFFPDFRLFHSSFPSNGASPRQQTNMTSAILASYGTFGPFLTRLSLTSPMFSVLLQRDSIDIGGNLGQLSIGDLPEGVKTESLTWVKLREYSQAQGGLAPPPDAPNEVYPIAWEVPIDDVYMDGQKLPRSNLSSASISLSALIDTGNSLIRGPSDVVQFVNRLLGGGDPFPCSTPHTLAFLIGGQLFPIDPRDFISQSYTDNVASCVTNLAPTDAPSESSGFLYSWSLGDPFLKGVLASFYYGNLSYPSKDPPRLGFLSTVPSDADQRLKDAVNAASANGGNFPSISERAPSATLRAAGMLSNGVPQAPPPISTNTNQKNAAPRVRQAKGFVWWVTGSSVIAWTML